MSDFCDVAAFAQRLGLMPDPRRRAPHSRLAGPVEPARSGGRHVLFCDRASTVSDRQRPTCARSACRARSDRRSAPAITDEPTAGGKHGEMPRFIGAAECRLIVGVDEHRQRFGAAIGETAPPPGIAVTSPAIGDVAAPDELEQRVCRQRREDRFAWPSDSAVIEPRRPSVRSMPTQDVIVLARNRRSSKLRALLQSPNCRRGRLRLGAGRLRGGSASTAALARGRGCRTTWPLVRDPQQRQLVRTS